MKQCKNCKQTIDEKDKVCPNCGKKQNNTAKTIILVVLACFIPVILLVTILIVSIGALVAGSASNTVSMVNLFSNETQEQNLKFESYFGTDVTPNEAKNLLEEIRKNNVSAKQKNEPSIVGVCYLSKNVENNEGEGVYYYDTDTSEEITKTIFEKKNFSSDVQTILDQLSNSSSNTVNVANSSAWKDDSKGITGFENGKVQTGSTGGYYSSGYIRLIYIIDNNNDIYAQANSNLNTNSSTFNQNNFSGFQSNTTSNNYGSSIALNSQDAITRNLKFESYFGTAITANEVKNLLSEIRTNNLTADRNEEPTIMGVCFISKEGTTNQVYGIYSMDNINTNSAFFDNLYFCPETSQITRALRSGKTYTVNVPNQIAWKDDANGKTGFETADNTMGQSITGNSGGYYSSGYVRLIYIIEND